MEKNEGYNVNLKDGPHPDKLSEVNIPQESLLQIIWRRHWIILLTVGTCLAGMFVYLYKATPIFTSTSRVYVEQRGPKIFDEQEGYLTKSKDYLYTQSELIKTESIVSAVVNQTEFARMKTFDQVDNKIIYLQKGLDVSVGKKDGIISVSFDSPYRVEAAQLINEVVNEYVSYHAERKRSTASEVLEILQKEKINRDQELKVQRQAILDFKRENNEILFIEDQRGNLMSQSLARLLGLQDTLAEARIATINAKEGYEAAQGLSDDPDKLRQFVEARYTSRGYYPVNQEQLQLRNELSQLQQQKLGLANKVNPEHPAMKSIESKISQVENRLLDLDQSMTQAYLEVARQQWLAAQELEKELQKTVDDQTKQAQEHDIKTTEYAILQASLTRTENLCDILDNRIKELNVTEDVGALNISILEVARPAEKPSKPQKARFMAIALVMGLLLGVGLVLMLDWMDTRLRSADEVSATLGVPVLGIIPMIRGKKDLVTRGQTVHQEPTSTVAEAYKTIRTAVYFGVPDGQAQTLLVTSPGSGDGKSTLVSNLATAMAQAGQRTLVLDCDFRKPVQHAIFQLDQEPGLSSVLTGQAELEKAIINTAEKNLDVLTCGAIPINPSELLNSQTFNDVIDKLSKKYDRLIIDSPPVMPVADARILGAMSDVTLVVLRAEKSTRKTSAQARDGLLSVGTNILGAVVNGISRSTRYGYYKGYYYGYKYGYGYGHSRRSKIQPPPADAPEPAAVN